MKNRLQILPCIGGHGAPCCAMVNKSRRDKGLPNGKPLLLGEALVVEQLVLECKKRFVGVPHPGKHFRFVPVGATVEAPQVLVGACDPNIQMSPAKGLVEEINGQEASKTRWRSRATSES